MIRMLKSRIARLLSVLIVFLAVLLPGSESPSTAAQSPGNLVVFSGRRESLLTPVLNLFKDQTGIQVSVKFGETPELAEEIVQLLKAGQAVPDVFIGDDAGTLEFFMRESGAFVPYTSAQIEKIPARYRASDATWMGLSGRSRVMIYNKNLVKTDEIPSSAFDLIDPKWSGKLATTDGHDTDGFVPWISALRLTLGDEFTKTFLRKLLDNRIEIFSEQTDVSNAVARGEFAIGLVNNYYVYRLQKGSDPALANVGIFYHDQGAAQVGTLINATAAAIVKGAANSGNAQAFLDFLASPAAQEVFAKLNFEYPLLPGVATHPDVLRDAQQATGCTSDDVFACIKQLVPTPSDLGAELEKTQQFLEETGWF